MTTPVTSTTHDPAAATSGTAANSDAMAQLSGNFNTFLTLLTTPAEEPGSHQPDGFHTFTQQLVEFSQVEQQINTNTNLKTLISQGTTQLGAYATSYLGKTVSVTNGNASLTNGAAIWTYSLGTAASSHTLTRHRRQRQCGLYRHRRNRLRQSPASTGTARTITATSLPTAPTS